MRFVFHPHQGGGKAAYVHPILDLHENVMISARIVPFGDRAGSGLVLEPGKAFDVNEKLYPWGYYAATFFKSSPDFQTVNHGPWEGSDNIWFALNEPPVEQEPEHPRVDTAGLPLRQGPKGRRLKRKG